MHRLVLNLSNAGLSSITFLLATLAMGQSSDTTPKTDQPVVKALSTDKEYRDYTSHNFKLDLMLLRGGAHDTSNTNDYYFLAKLSGVLNTQEEKKKPFEEQTKIELPAKKFGEIQVNSLQYWRTNPKEGDTIELPIDGDSIRELVATTMKTHDVSEEDVAVRLDIEIWEVAKSFIFFGEDIKVAETHFFPIPQSRFDTPARTNQNLEMGDGHGALVKFAVIYEMPLNSAKK